MVDEPEERSQSQSGRRSFTLTPRSRGQAGNAQPPEPRMGKSRRHLLIAGGAAIPFVATIASRPAFAQRHHDPTSIGKMSVPAASHTK
jgi:hypothetical protein